MVQKTHAETGGGRSTRRGAKLAAVAAALLLTAVACGDDSSSSSGAAATTAANATATTAGAASTGGTATTTAGGKAATLAGDVTIGSFYQGAGTVAAEPEIGPTMDAAVQYVNNELGGVGGHKIKLETCITDATPASTQNCAQELAGKKPAIISAPYDYNPAVASKITGGAGLLTIGSTVITPTDYTDPNVYYLSTGSPGAAVALIQAALQTYPNAKNAAFFAPDIAPITPLVEIAKNTFAAKGITLTVSKFQTSSTDLIGPWAALKPASQDFILALLPGPFCVPGIKAAAQAQNKTPVFTTSLCGTADIAAQTNNGAEGWYITSVGDDPNGPSPDAQIYRAAMKKYAGEKAALGGYAPVAFQNILATAVVLNTAGYDHLTTDNLRKAAQTGGPVFMAGGESFKCGSEPKLSSVCNFIFLLNQMKGSSYVLIPGDAGKVNTQQGLITVMGGS